LPDDDLICIWRD